MQEEEEKEESEGEEDVVVVEEEGEEGGEEEAEPADLSGPGRQPGQVPEQRRHPVRPRGNSGEQLRAPWQGEDDDGGAYLPLQVLHRLRELHPT